MSTNPSLYIKGLIKVPPEGISQVGRSLLPTPVALPASKIGLISFDANWRAVPGATGYLIEVARDEAFTNIIPYYNSKDVENVTNYHVKYVFQETTYYYRIRAYAPGKVSLKSNIIAVKTFSVGHIYGALYNWYAANNTRLIAPAGWHLPSVAEWWNLMKFLDAAGTQSVNTAGGQLKDIGTTRWHLPNTGASNSTGFNGYGAGDRNAAGVFSGMNQTMSFIATDEYDADYFLGGGILVYDSNVFDGIGSVFNKKNGRSIRCFKDDSTLAPMTDFDNNVYPTVKIGTQVVTAANLCCTHYNDGTLIPELTDNGDWAADIDGAMCYYGNIAP